jgi:hypothetical protein
VPILAVLVVHSRQQLAAEEEKKNLPGGLQAITPLFREKWLEGHGKCIWLAALCCSVELHPRHCIEGRAKVLVRHADVSGLTWQGECNDGEAEMPSV